MLTPWFHYPCFIAIRCYLYRPTTLSFKSSSILKIGQGPRKNDSAFEPAQTLAVSKLEKSTERHRAPHSPLGIFLDSFLSAFVFFSACAPPYGYR